VRRARSGEEADATSAGPTFAMPLSLLAAVIVSSPATLAALGGRLDAPVAMTAFVAALAAVWIVAAIGTWALSVVDGPRSTRREPDAGHGAHGAGTTGR
jgi:hypothetical protein